MPSAKGGLAKSHPHQNARAKPKAFVHRLTVGDNLDSAGAFSGLGMGLNGVLTAILLPLICRLL
jgi:hypothetical protein